MAYVWVAKQKELNPDWKPIEERSKEEQEDAYDKGFDLDDEEDVD